jgi:hypothetical protein
MALSFPVKPDVTLPMLAQSCIDLVPQLQRKISVAQSVTIGTTETAVAHGLGAVPLTAMVLPHSNVAYWRSKAPDSRFVYLIAASSVVCDVAVIA